MQSKLSGHGKARKRQEGLWKRETMKRIGEDLPSADVTRNRVVRPEQKRIRDDTKDLRCGGLDPMCRDTEKR